MSTPTPARTSQVMDNPFLIVLAITGLLAVITGGVVDANGGENGLPILGIGFAVLVGWMMVAAICWQLERGRQ